MTRRVSSDVFIGRERESARVAELLSAARATGAGATVLVSGEAGVGKTRFSAEVASVADGAGWVVVRGICDEFSAARPFGAVREVAQSLGNALERYAPAELDGPVWAAIAHLTGTASTPPVTTLGPGATEQFILDLLRKLAHVRPLLVVIDDLHWADESTRVLFARLARGLLVEPALVLGCYRANELYPGHPLRQVLAAVHRTGQPEHVELPTFTRTEVEAFVDAAAAGKGADDVDRLLLRSGGNAFLLEELLAAPMGGLPRGAADVVLARVDSLGEDAITVAEIISLDSALPGPVLAAALDLPGTRVVETTDLLVQRALLVAQNDSFTFRHPLIREILYARIPPGRCAVLHARVAAAFQGAGTHYAGEAARHWHLAGHAPKALIASVSAARSAANLGAFPEAADHYERALSLWEQIPNPEEVTGRVLAAVVDGASAALQNSRRFARAAELIEAQVASHRFTPAEESSLNIRLGNAYRSALKFEDWRKSLGAFRRAVEVLDASVPPASALPVLCYYAIEVVLNYGLDADGRGAVESVEALIAADPSLDGLLPRIAQAAVAIAHGWPSATCLAAEAYELSRNLAEPNFAQRHAALLGEHTWNATEGIAARNRLFEGGFGPGLGLHTDWMITRSLARLGQWQESLQRLEDLANTLGEEPLLDAPDTVVCGWGTVLVRSGRVDEARRWVELASPLTLPAITAHSMGFAATRVELARFDRDRDASRSAIGTIIDSVRGHFIALSGEAVAFAIAHEADFAFDAGYAGPDAVALVDHWIARLESCLAEAPGRVGVDDFGTFLDQCRAERARLSGDDCVEAWEALACRWEGLPRPYHAAYARFRAGFALLTRDRTRDARQRAMAHLDAALATCREIGAKLLEAHVVELRRVGGFHARTTQPLMTESRELTVRPMLTHREQQVLALLVTGATNGRIGIVLGISVRTAGVHVSNIIRKLEASNRVEAAMRASALGFVGRSSEVPRNGRAARPM